MPLLNFLVYGSVHWGLERKYSLADNGVVGNKD